MSTVSFVDPEVEKIWNLLRIKVNAFISTVDRLTDEERSLTPPKGFNSVETLYHLALTDKFELGLIKKTGRPLDKAPKINFIGRMAMNGMSKPRPMPTMSEMTPTANGKANLEAVRDAGAEWNRVLDEATAFVAKCGKDQTLLKHPLFGRFGPFELAELMNVHMDYHSMRLRAVLPDFYLKS